VPQFRKRKAGIKLHLGLKYHGEQNLYPSKATVTDAKCHDVNEVLNLIDYCEGVINVLDIGYADFRKLDEITDVGWKFVVRIKNNTTTWINEQFEDAKGVEFASKGPVGEHVKRHVTSIIMSKNLMMMVIYCTYSRILLILRVTRASPLKRLLSFIK
jgi:hypothetical protein